MRDEEVWSDDVSKHDTSKYVANEKGKTSWTIGKRCVYCITKVRFVACVCLYAFARKTDENAANYRPTHTSDSLEVNAEFMFVLPKIFDGSYFSHSTTLPITFARNEPLQSLRYIVCININKHCLCIDQTLNHYGVPLALSLSPAQIHVMITITMNVAHV